MMERYEKTSLLLAVLLVAALFFASHRTGTPLIESHCQEEFGELNAAIDLGELPNNTKGFLTGFSYYLLEEYAAASDSKIEIRLGTDYVEMADIVILPLDSVKSRPHYAISRPVDSLIVFATPQRHSSRIARINKWLEDFVDTDEYRQAHSTFFTVYDPLRRAANGRKSTVLSPYDDIIKAYADSIGWDWRMLAAIIYQESRFEIDAQSVRGAFGLMQMMPATADKMQAGNLLCPEESIRAGALYLKKLSRLYHRRAENATEKYKFTLAAYNAGLGRMKDIINFAESKGVKTSSWDSLCSVMLEMKDSAVIACCDTVKLGTFKGNETRAYVDRVMSLYEAFKIICP